jgi:hypothetical protein
MIATRVALRVANRIDAKIAEPVDPEQDVALRCALPRLQPPELEPQPGPEQRMHEGIEMRALGQHDAAIIRRERRVLDKFAMIASKGSRMRHPARGKAGGGVSRQPPMARTP